MRDPLFGKPVAASRELLWPTSAVSTDSQALKDTPLAGTDEPLGSKAPIL